MQALRLGRSMAGGLKLVSDDYNAKITVLQKQISGLQDQLTLANEESTKAALSTQEIVNRQTAIQKSEQPTVTSSVAKAAPAVVSIVISKDIPQYTVVYKNPFGDDPFFQDVGIRVPVYVPTGKTQTQKIGAGTGFLVSSNGYIVTNKHVVADENASYTVLLSTETQEQATVVYRDTTNDIAIIKITGNNYPVIHFADSSTLKLGQTVIAIGQYNNSVSIEVVSGLNRTITAFNSGGCFPDALPRRLPGSFKPMPLLYPHQLLRPFRPFLTTNHPQDCHSRKGGNPGCVPLTGFPQRWGASRFASGRRDDTKSIVHHTKYHKFLTKCERRVAIDKML